MIPDSIKREHVLKAIEEIKRSEIPAQRDSDTYDLEYDNKLYPPKYVVSLANKYANGKELDHKVFGGGPESNTFLKSLGFNIVNKEPKIELEKQEHDFAPRLRDYLENIYSIVLEKGSGRAHLVFPSGTIINIRGSKILKDHRGFYTLQEDEYKEIADNPNRYFAVVYGNPENTFVFPKEAVVTFFNGFPFNSREEEKPMWYFDIREYNENFYLKVHSAGDKEQKIDNYLNKWDQIEELKPFYDGSSRAGSPNYWILVVTNKPEQNLTAKQILTTRLNDKFWGLNARTPFRTLLRKDDNVIFSYGAKEFLGTATLDSDSFELREEEKSQVSHDNDFFKADFGMRLKNMELWEDPKPVQKSIDVLSFVKNKKHYMAYFQGGVRKVSADDYNNIINLPQSNNLLSFIDLQKFLLEKMQMQANYQPIMIKTLLLLGGKASKNDIATKIKELNSETVQAYELFSQAKTPVEVAIELDLRESQVTKYYREFWKLKGLYKLNLVYEEIKDDIAYFVKLHSLSKAAGMSTEYVVNLLEIANNDLQSIEHKYRKLQRNVDYLESKALEAGITLEDLKSQIQNANQVLYSCRLSCQKEVRKMLQLHRQNMRLGALLRQFKNSDEEYLKIRYAAKQAVRGVLSDSRQLLKFAILSLTDRYVLILSNLIL